MDELWDVYDRNRNKTGRFHERGEPMAKGDYHLIVQVWILNGNGEFLITKRNPSQSFDGTPQAAAPSQAMTA